jgi:hypothetical protein
MVNTTAANAGTAVGDVIGSAAASNVPTSFAVLIGTTDTTPDGPTGPPLASTGTGQIELTVSTTGAATAVWEVFNTNPAASETLTFAVYLTYAANVPQVTGTSVTVSLSYGPTSSGTQIPNFANADQIMGKVFDLSSCRTKLLFPYVTSNGGFETGIAIVNTTLDSPVFIDAPQSGTCTLYFYPTPAGLDHGIDTPPVAAGDHYLNLIGQLVPGFTGYMIASCNFHLAHGFVFIADWGNPATSSAMGYLALVIPDIVSREAASPRSEGLDQ